MDRPKLLILSPRFPFPIEKGDKLRLHHQIKHLKDSFEIHLVSLTEEEVLEKYISELTKHCESVHLIVQRKARDLLAGIDSFKKNLPLQVSYYYERSIQKKIDKIVQDLEPDLIFVQLVRMAEYALNYDVPKVLDYMDAMSLNMKREAKRRRFPFSIVFSRESRLLALREKFYSKFFDFKVIISEQDKSYLESLDIDKLIVQSNGVDLNYFNCTNLIDKPKEDFDLVFVGNMGYLPNIEAAEFISKDILQSKESKSLLIAGARPHRRVEALRKKNVEISGWVEDIRNSYLRARLVLAPIFTGAGQQNKILEAMALSCCCITTSQVNAAIGAEVGKEIIIADSAEQFKIEIDSLLSNRARRIEIGENARIFVEQKFQWKKNVDILAQALLKQIKER